MMTDLFKEEQLLKSTKEFIVNYFRQLEEKVSGETGKFAVSYDSKDSFVKCSYADRHISFNIEQETQIWVDIQSPNLFGGKVTGSGFKGYSAFRQINGTYYSSDQAREFHILNEERLDELMTFTFEERESK